MHRDYTKLITVFFLTMFFLSNAIKTNADYFIPETVKIGLSFGTNAVNNFSIKSSSGFCIENSDGEIIVEDSTSTLMVKQDEMQGYYHIQVGETFSNIEEAKAFYDVLLPDLSDVFIDYENGWSIYTGNYEDENKCLDQIKSIAAKDNSFKYRAAKTDKKRIQFVDPSTSKVLYSVNADNDIYIKSLDQDSKYMEYNSKKFRGHFILKRISESDITVINELDLEEYLYGVVPSESISSWPIEALKAQAVASRNFAVLNLGKHSKYGFDLCSGQDCQAYKGISQETPKTNEAVDLTKGKLIFYNDELVNAVYHSSSGGHTESSENIWSSQTPYLTGVDDSLGLGNKYDNWIKTFDKNYIKQKMIESKLDVGEILDIIPRDISANGRVINVEVKGTKGTQMLKKEKIRNILGSMELKSIWYDLNTDADVSIYNIAKGTPETKRLSDVYSVSDSGMKKLSGSMTIYVKGESCANTFNTIPSQYTFRGRGFGHGVGMSQYGAKGMADAGYTYIQILEHYYKDSVVR